MIPIIPLKSAAVVTMVGEMAVTPTSHSQIVPVRGGLRDEWLHGMPQYVAHGMYLYWAVWYRQLLRNILLH